MTSSNIFAVTMITSFSVEDYVWKIYSYTAIPDVNGTWTRPNRAKSSAITIPTAVIYIISQFPLRWRHNGRDGVSNHQPHGCFSTVYSVEDHWEHQSSALLAFVQGIHRRPVNSPHKMTSNAEYVSIWWRYHVYLLQFINKFYPIRRHCLKVRFCKIPYHLFVYMI